MLETWAGKKKKKPNPFFCPFVLLPGCHVPWEVTWLLLCLYHLHLADLSETEEEGLRFVPQLHHLYEREQLFNPFSLVSMSIK